MRLKEVEYGLFFRAEDRVVDEFAGLQHGLDLEEHDLLGLVLLLGDLGKALDLVEAVLHNFEVGYDDLRLDDFHVPRRLYARVDMGHALALEAPDHMGDRVDLADLAEEPVAQSFTFVGVLDETGDIDELDGRGGDFLGLDQIGKRGEARVGHRHDADVRLDCAEGIRLGSHGQGSEGVEYSRFAGVRQTDDAAGETH